MTNWISYFIIIPLFPILSALVFSLLKGESIQFSSIFGGSELYMFSVVIIAATRSDIELSSDAAFKTGNYRRITTLLVPAMLFCSAFYGIVFMNLRAENPDIPDVSIASFGLIVGILTTLVCGFLQYKLRSSPAIEASS
ncbi:MAG: hypothetical protein OXG68_17290 [Chloroflexi bacterium]|nr:hypothetical protein [Chloroflexota bacterium]